MTTRRKGSAAVPIEAVARPEAAQHALGNPSHAAALDSTRHEVAPSRNNLVLPRSPLIGRNHEVAAIQQLLLQEQVGLLTLTGPGGIGKTRLALQVAANLLDHFVDGVYFVALAPISDPELVSAAMAQTLGVREVAGRPLSDSLQEYLRDKQLLLVLDNFEHILAAAPLVSALLHQCRRLKVLVTSRASLHLYGEQEFPVAPLALPDTNQLSALEKDPAAGLAEFAAVALFCQRARAVKPDFALTADNATDVAKICIGLDGLPLAIELAAARIKLFSPAALLARLGERLTLLTGGSHDLPTRQRTLRNEIAWSYDLLTVEEQVLFRRLAVFMSGFTLEAAQVIGDAAGDVGIDVLNTVASLVDKNLLRQLSTSDGEARFGMLETIKAYGLEQLTVNGETEAIYWRHAKFFLGLAEEATARLRSSQQGAWLQRLDADYPNLQAALGWSLQIHKDEASADPKRTGVRLANALFWFWYIRAYLTEGRQWLTQTLHACNRTELSIERAQALYGDGALAWQQGDCVYAHTQIAASITLWRQLIHQSGLAYALTAMACVMDCQSKFDEMQRLATESAVLFRTLEDPWGLALALTLAGHAAAAVGNYDHGQQMFEESIMLFQQTGDTWGTAIAFGTRARAALRQGDFEHTRVWLEQALAVRGPIEDKWQQVSWRLFLGVIARQQGDHAKAIWLLEQSLPLAREIGARDRVASILLELGLLLQQQGNLRQAAAYFYECLVCHQQEPTQKWVILLLASLGAIAVNEQEWEHAGYLGGAAEGLYATNDHTFTPVEQADYVRTMTVVRLHLHETAMKFAWPNGQRLTLEQAITYALATPIVPKRNLPALPDSPIILPSLPANSGGLTSREVEVLQLLAQGFTYAQIADKLIVSKRTVNSHITSIYSKLGVNGRAAATRFAVAHRLL